MTKPDIKDFELHVYEGQLEQGHRVGYEELYSKDIVDYVKELEEENEKLTDFIKNLQLDINAILR